MRSSREPVLLVNAAAFVNGRGVFHPLALLALCLVVGCGSRSPLRTDMDASLPDDAAVDAGRDSPPLPDSGPRPDVQPPPMCVGSLAGELRGTTPWGPIDMSLTQFSVADCCDRGGGWIELSDATGNSLQISFLYSIAECDFPRTIVATDIAGDAQALYMDADGEGDTATITIAFTVTRLQEWEELGDAAVVDVSIQLSGPGWDVEPIVLDGTFCEWAALIC